MTAQQHFWDTFYGWSLGLGALITMIVVIGGMMLLDWGDLEPFTDMITQRQRHRHRLAELRVHGELAKAGVDPGYVAFLDGQLNRGDKDDH